MKTSEGDFGKGTPPVRAFPKEILEKILPNVGKIKSPVRDRTRHYRLYYNGVNRINPQNKNDKTTDSSKCAFIVAWQKYE